MDPRVSDLRKAKAAVSPLMRLKMSTTGIVNACPYGCENRMLDDNGYCHHLVGFTIPGSEKLMEVLTPPQAEHDGRRVIVSKPVPVPSGAHLERITVSCRVYVKNAKPFKEDQEAA